MSHIVHYFSIEIVVLVTSLEFQLKVSK